MYVFWADRVSGDPVGGLSGFRALGEISREVGGGGNRTWPGTAAGRVDIPLGNSNSQPALAARRRRRRGIARRSAGSWAG